MDESQLESSEFYHARFNNFSTLLIVPVAILIVLVILFSLLAQREITIKAPSQIASGKAVAILQSTSNNQITHDYLKEGQHVHKGQLLVTYRSQSLKHQLTLLQQQQQLFQQQLAALSTWNNSLQQNQDLFAQTDQFGYEDLYRSYQNQRQVYLLENELLQQKSQTNTAKKDKLIANLNTSLQTAQAKLAAYQNIAQAIKQGSDPGNSTYRYLYTAYLTAKQTQDPSTAQAQALTNIQQQIDQLQDSIQATTQQKLELTDFDSSQYDVATNQQKLASLQAEQLRSCSQQQIDLKQKQSQNNLKLKEVQDSTHDLQVKAPITGIVHILNPNQRNKLVGTGNPLAQIYPPLTVQKPLKLQAYVAPHDISTVRRQQILRVKISRNVPTPIVLNGRIKTISVAPVTVGKSNYYVVEALTKVPAAQIANLHYGMSGQGSIITGRESFFTYYKNRLFNHEDN